VQIEADSSDITMCSHDDKPTIGMFGFLCSLASPLVSAALLSSTVFSTFII